LLSKHLRILRNESHKGATQLHHSAPETFREKV